MDIGKGIELIRSSTLKDLTKKSFIERELIPQLGLNIEILDEQPASLAPLMGTGLGWRIWQYPNQFSAYLIHLSKSARSINSYIEIGCRYGGTFALTTEYIARFNPKFRKAVAVDLVPQSRFLKAYSKFRAFEYIRCNSHGPEFRSYLQYKRFDLALIDGDHSLDGVYADYSNLLNRARCLVFHDVKSRACPGTTRFWRVLKRTIPHAQASFFEAVAQYKDTPRPGPYMGIGIMQKKPHIA